MSRCPGCGRCKTCGQPTPFVVYPQIPHVPYAPPPYIHPQPWGTSPQPWGIGHNFTAGHYQ